MEQINTIVYADISTPYPAAEVTAKQGDAGSRTLEIRLTQAGRPYTIGSGVSARIYIRKPDKNIVYNNAIITNATLGYVTIELTSQALAAAGRAQCEIMLYAGQDLLTSIPFILRILPQVHDDNAVESANEFGALTDALDKVATLTPEGTVAENSIDTNHIKNEAVTAEKLDADVRGNIIPILTASGAVSGDNYVYDVQGSVDANTLQNDGFIRILIDSTNPAGKSVLFKLHLDILVLNLTPMCSIYGEAGNQVQTEFPAGFFQPNQLITAKIYDGQALVITDGLLPDYTAGTPDGSITTAKLADGAVEWGKVSEDMLSPIKRLTVDFVGADRPIPLSILPYKYIADNIYTLSLEARLTNANANSISLGPMLTTDSGSEYYWDSGSYLNLTSEWQTVTLSGIKGIQSIGLYVYGPADATPPPEVEIRNLQLCDTFDTDVIDHLAFQDAGLRALDIDSPTVDWPANYLLPSLDYVKSLLHSAEIPNGSITTEKIADEAVTADKLADGVLPSAPLYGVCNDAANTGDKTVTIEGFTLAVGRMVVIKFVNGNTAANVALNINGTGLHYIYRDGSSSVNVRLTDNETMFLVYDGTYYVAIDTSYATSTNAGKVKLNDTLTSTSAFEALTAAQGKVLKDLIDDISSGGEIADGAVTTAKLANGAVTGNKIAEGALTLDKLSQSLIDDLNAYIIDPALSQKLTYREDISSEDQMLSPGVYQAGNATYIVFKDTASTGAVYQIGILPSDDTCMFAYRSKNASGWTDWENLSQDLPAASTSQAGIVQLNNTLTSTSATQALTAAQGKALKDMIDDIPSGGEIADGAVTTAKLADGAVTQDKIDSIFLMGIASEISSATSTASQAATTAQNAANTADGLTSTVSELSTQVQSAQSAAESAQSTAGSAQSSAETALSNASSAQSVAESAQATADAAQSTASSLESRVADLENRVSALGG